MADDPRDNVITLPVNGNGGGAVEALPERARRFPMRPKRRFRVNADAVVQSVMRRAQERTDAMQAPDGWNDMRLQRYAKFRGLLPEKTWPWPGCSNVEPGMLMTSELRANAGLHNVVMTLRPLLQAKSQSRGGVSREEKITQVVNYQLLIEPGPAVAERRLSDFIGGGLQDGNAVAYTPWLRDERMVIETASAEPIPEDGAPADWLEAAFRKAIPGVVDIEMHETKNHVFAITYDPLNRAPKEATAEVFEDEDGALEIVITRERTVYDGPAMLNVPIDDVLVPTRCTNLQPPSEWNPGGAGDVILRWQYRLDDVIRLKRAGVFNWLDADGLAAIIAAARGNAGIATLAKAKKNDDLQEQKDIAEGREHETADPEVDEEIGHLPVSMLLCFDQWRVDGEETATDVFWIVAEDGDVLCEGRRLTERWPAVTPYRPLAEWCPIPVPGRWHGISLLELGEGLYDLVKGTFDQSFDSWTVGTLPFFFYGAAAKLNADVLSITPGQGVPVPGNPRENVYFPNLAQRDISGALGIIGLGLQFYERKMAQGGLQSGQVPTGKASALRTTGTTMALLQQGDVRADQILIRLFQGLAQVGLNFHRMNRHLLPPGKEIRMVGWEGPDALGYLTLESAEEIDADAAFDFRPDFLTQNPAVLRESIQALMGVLITPLAFQLGTSNASTVNRLMRDFVRALRLDAKRYTADPSPDALPHLLAEEAIEAITRGQEPVGVPMEGATAHLNKLFAWANSDQFGLLPAEHAVLAREWMRQVAERAKTERAMAAAQQFQQAMTGGGGMEGGVPTTGEEPAMTQAKPPEMAMAETTGA